MVRVKVPATIANLGPGFDTLGVAVSLFNIIEMDFSDEIKIEVLNEGQNILPENEANLVYQSAKKIIDRFGFEKKLHIRLINNIPLARGLGSSAAAIVGGIVAVNELLGNPLSMDEIINIATNIEGHPDNVVPALLGGFTISLFDGEKVFYKKFSLPEKELCFVVAVPQFHLKTLDARKVLPEKIPLKDAVYNMSRTALLVACIAQKDLSFLNALCKDKLHQPYRSSLIPGMEEIINRGIEKGLLSVFLSGAGPSIAGICDKKDAEKAGEFMVGTFSNYGIKANYLILDPCNEGVSVCT
ncbi:homoserine kinase [Thermovenabulum sp.]|uniref:homoserine kinase n=1 Tax=Thermovenabulum sp. TaxID=3100335 RepID=UPI003C798F07